MPLPWQVFLTHCNWCCPADLAVLLVLPVLLVIDVVLAQQWRGRNVAC